MQHKISNAANYLPGIRTPTGIITESAVPQRSPVPNPPAMPPIIPTATIPDPIQSMSLLRPPVMSTVITMITEVQRASPAPIMQPVQVPHGPAAGRVLLQLQAILRQIHRTVMTRMQTHVRDRDIVQPPTAATGAMTTTAADLQVIVQLPTITTAHLPHHPTAPPALMTGEDSPLTVTIKARKQCTRLPPKHHAADTACIAHTSRHGTHAIMAPLHTVPTTTQPGVLGLPQAIKPVNKYHHILQFQLDKVKMKG